jgi:hypothetical protein
MSREGWGSHDRPACSPRLARTVSTKTGSEQPDVELAPKVDLDAYRRWKNPLDQIVEFLLRRVYEEHAGELDADGILEAIGWYFATVLEEPSMRAYCQRHGYAPIVEFADRHVIRPAPRPARNQHQHE